MPEKDQFRHFLFQFPSSLMDRRGGSERNPPFCFLIIEFLNNLASEINPPRAPSLGLKERIPVLSVRSESGDLIFREEEFRRERMGKTLRIVMVRHGESQVRKVWEARFEVTL